MQTRGGKSHMTKKKRRTAPGLVADRSLEVQGTPHKCLLQSSLWKRGATDSIWRGMGMGLLDKGPNAFCGTVDGHPEESDRVTVGAVTPVLAGLALADGCLRATQTASDHLELMYNGGPCELRQQCKRSGRLSRW
jgi:hypothetical protein